MFTRVIELILATKDGQNVIRAQVEVLLWMLFSLLISLDLTLRSLQNGYVKRQDLLEHPLTFTLSILAILFPMVFSFIYGNLPLEQFRRYVKRDDYLIAKNGHHEIEKSPTEKAIDYFETLVSNSAALADKIFSRASLYLLAGVIIAFIGLVFFYLQSASHDTQSSVQQAIINLAPKFGVLIFIEFIAIFFLKQYRALMDEFRYYEELKRSREESLAILRMASSNTDSFNIESFLEKNSLKSSVGKFESGQSSDLIESRKMEKGELDAVVKIIEALRK